MNLPGNLTLTLPFEQIAGFGPAYLVGGTVRDLLLARTPTDYDIVVAGNPEDFARQLAAENQGRVVILGKPGLLLYRVVIPGNLIDVTEIFGESIEADLGARDFTMNAMALELATGRIIDPFEGQKDIDQRIVRMVSADAFRRDPVRLIRAYRMAAAFSFAISIDTTDAIAKHAYRIQASASERVRDEWMKILDSTESAASIRQMAETRLIDVIFPELPKSPEQKQLPLYAYENLEEILRDPETQFPKWANETRVDMAHGAAAMLKCCGLFRWLEPKPGASDSATDRTSLDGHSNRQADVAVGIADRLRFSNYQTRFLDTVIRHVPLTHRLCRAELTRREEMRFFTRFDEHVSAMLLLEAATEEDATTSVDAAFQKYYEHFRIINRQPPLINGRDLIEELALDPSPVFTLLLSTIAEERLMGNLTTRDEALEFAKQTLAGKTTGVLE